MPNQMSRQERIKDRLLLVVFGLGGALVVLRTAIPDRPIPRVVHTGSVRTKLDDQCVLMAASEVDAGVPVVFHHVHRLADDAPDTGRPGALYVRQRQFSGGWEVSAQVRVGDVQPVEQETFRESLTRTVALRVLERCAGDAGWDGGVDCERRGDAERKTCLLP